MVYSIMLSSTHINCIRSMVRASILVCWVYPGVRGCFDDSGGQLICTITLAKLKKMFEYCKVNDFKHNNYKKVARWLDHFFNNNYIYRNDTECNMFRPLIDAYFKIIQMLHLYLR